MGRREKIIHIHQMKAKLHKCLSCGCYHYKDICTKCASPSWITIEDDEYREILTSLTGKSSCSDMDEFELQRIEFKFQSFGWVDTSQGRYAMTAARRRLIAIIFTEAQMIFGDEKHKARIEGFVEKKTGNKRLDHCSEDQLRMVIGWIRRAAKYQN